MIEPHLQEYWAMQRAFQADPGMTMDPEIYQGIPVHLLGMTYYLRMTDFEQVNQNLHKVHVFTKHGKGLAKMGARRLADELPNGGEIDPVLPQVDMVEEVVAHVSSDSVRADIGVEFDTATYSYRHVQLADGSSNEHATINSFFRQGDAVSAVRLLQHAEEARITGGVTHREPRDRRARGCPIATHLTKRGAGMKFLTGMNIT
jgi:hypothetical protein